MVLVAQGTTDTSDCFSLPTPGGTPTPIGSSTLTGIVQLLQRDVPDMLKVVWDVHPNAFVSVEQARAIHRGWIRAARGNHR
jgi:hypothetical protein